MRLTAPLAVTDAVFLSEYSAQPSRPTPDIYLVTDRRAAVYGRENAASADLAIRPDIRSGQPSQSLRSPAHSTDLAEASRHGQAPDERGRKEKSGGGSGGETTVVQ